MPILVGVVAIAGAIGATLAAVFGPLYLALFRREVDRAAEMEDVARSLGLTFSRHDPAYPSSTAFRLPFELFSRGVDHTCENFMSGRSGDIEIVAFDFLYRQRFDSDGAPHNDLDSEPICWSCALTTVPGWRPHVVIEPASSSRTARADGEPVRLEWGDFNARYRVVSPERGFAAALLDVELMGWLVDDAPRLPLTWEVQRDHVLCRTPGLDPERYAELIRAAAEFARRVARGASN